MTGLEPLILGLSAASTIVSGVGALSAGAAAETEAKFKAEQLEKRANEERAAGQRQMFEKRRDAEFTQSRLIAGAAAGGGNTTDTGILNLGGDIASRGEYQALTELYKGENAARGHEDQAAAARMSGSNARMGSYFRAAGTILDGGSSFGEKYHRYR